MTTALRIKRHTIIYLILFVQFVLTLQLSAEENPATPVLIEDKVVVADVEAKLQEAKSKLDELQPVIATLLDNDTSARVDGIRKKNSLLTELKNLFERQLTSLQRIQALKTSITALEKEIEQFQTQGLTEEPPYSVAQYDSLTDLIASEQQKSMTLNLTKDTLARELVLVQNGLEKADKKVRDIEESIKNATSEKLPQLEGDLAYSKIEQSVARNWITFKKLQLRANELELSLSQKQLKLLRDKMHDVAKQVQFDKKDLSLKLLEIDKKRDELDLALEKAKITLSTNEVRLADAREQLAAARGEQEIQKQRDQVNNYDAWFITSQYKVDNLEERSQLYTVEKELWQIRYNLFNGEQLEEVPQWISRVEVYIEQLDRNQAIAQSRLLTVSSTITDLQKKANEELAGSDRTVLESQMRALRNREELLTERLTNLNAILRMGKSVQAQLEKEATEVSIRDVMTYVGTVLGGIWNQDIVVLENNSVTVKKVVLSLLLFLLGLVLAKRVTHFFRLHTIKAFRIDENASAAIEKISYYFLVVVLLLFALHMVNIPLTLFTFMGGALAIAVGFGAQNLLNNFLSGLIILMERPIKINDVIEVEGNYGRVRDIGARYTLIRLFSGIDVLVPNSAILEKNVINWTHSDLNVRFSVKVGVAYGTDPRKVEHLLMRVAKEDSRILKFPEPIVIFGDFGDNSLNFEVFFWLQVNQMMDARIASSDLRYRIDTLFKEENITIAFPQRDIHLDSQHPLQVEIVSQQKSQIDNLK